MRDQDWWAAIGCYECHSHMDQYQADNPDTIWKDAIHETQEIFFKLELLVIS